MFSKSRPTPASGSSGVTPRAGTAGSTFSVLGSDVVIEGHVTADVDLHLDGRVEGDVSCATLVQGPTSLIRGAVRADSARLAGTIEGSVDVGELVIQASARVTGDVAYGKLTIEQGAQVDGRFHPRGAAATEAGASGPQLVVDSRPAGLLASG